MDTLHLEGISKIYDNGHLLEDLVVTSAHGP